METSTPGISSAMSPVVGEVRFLDAPAATTVGGRLSFDTPADLDEALRLGVFFVRVPEGVDVSPGMRLCRSFYQTRTHADDHYRGHREEQHPDSKLGYSDRPDQVEQLQLEAANWDKYLPAEVTALLRQMQAITLDILYSVFDAVGMPERDWETVTGGARRGTGWCHSTINHYRSDLRGRAGIVEHTDSGFITVLYPDRTGLEVLCNGVWRPIEVRNDYFVVNLGDALEILTRNLPCPVTAVVHRVPERPAGPDKEDRSSFTVFMGPRYDMLLYQYSPDYVLGRYQGFRDFSVEKAKQLGYEFHPRL